MQSRRVAGIGLLALVGLAAGCGGGSVYVTRRPHWNFEDYPRIAVVAATPDDARAERDGQFLADRLTTLLSQNGAFEVLSRAEMAQVFQEQDLAKLADAVDQGTALPEGQVKLAQALVVPKITHYNLVQASEQQQVPVYGVDRQGRMYQTGTRLVWVHTHAAEVAVTIRVVDAGTGKILISHSPEPVVHKKDSRDRPPSKSPKQLAAEALTELADELYAEIAPVRVEVDLKDSMLLLATAYFDGNYDEVKKVGASLARVLLVVRDLPEGCEHNEFRVAIAAEEGRENLYEETFVWRNVDPKRGVAYEVPLDVLTSSGTSRFEAKLYSAGDPEPILKRSFKLERG